MKYKIFPVSFLIVIVDCGYSENYTPLQSFKVDDSEYYKLSGGYRAPESGIYNVYEPLASETVPDIPKKESLEKSCSVCVSRAKFKKIIKKLKKLAETQQTMYTFCGRAYRVTRFISSKKMKKRTLPKNPPFQNISLTEFFRAPSKRSRKAPSVFQEIPSVQADDSEKQSADLKNANSS